MRLRCAVTLLLVSVCIAFQNSGTQAAAQAITNVASLSRPHVILIVEENRSFSTVYPIGMPWLSAVADKNGIATNYFSDESGSLLDYLWLSSGSGEHAFGCSGGGCREIITSDNFFRELNHHGLSWKVYADSLPYVGFMGARSGAYVKRHNPAPWYSDIANYRGQCNRMVPFTQFAKDLADKDLPSFSLIIPDMRHDAHDGSPAMADLWLKRNIRPVLRSAYFMPRGHGVLFITFDNGDGDRQSHVFTAVIGPNVIRGSKVDKAFRHENMLRTMMQLLGLKHFPGASAKTDPMREFFK